MTDIDERVAVEVMGWTKPKKGRYWEDRKDKSLKDQGYYTGYMQPNASMGLIFAPSTNIAHAFEMEERIEELGLKDKYCQALVELLEDEAGFHTCPADLFAFLHADPSDRCKAALKAKRLLI